MHVRELSVRRYGPMAPFHADNIGTFTLVHGPNERGKTLLIDALIRLLFKKDLKRSHLKLFGNLNRVSEKPEGYVVLATHAEEFKLEDDESIIGRVDSRLTPEDFRNLFVIRDSDLAVREERDYYEGITERLTGIKAREIDRVLKAVQHQGRLRSLSPDSLYVNSATQGKVADEMKRAGQLLEEITALRAQLADGDFESATERVVAAR